MVSVVVILADSVREWSSVLGGRKPGESEDFDSIALPATGD